MNIAVVIPALNEAESLPFVLPQIPNLVDRVVVVDNGSTDATREVAREHGAEVVWEPQRGYGSAVQAGMAHLEASPPDILVILDADGADAPANLPTLTDPIANDEADLVQADRTQTAEPGALTWVQRFGNPASNPPHLRCWRLQIRRYGALSCHPLVVPDAT